MSEHEAFDIKGFAAAHKISRSQTYVEIAAGRLAIVKVGRRTLILRAAAEAWRRRLEEERARSLHAPADSTQQVNISHVPAPDNKPCVAGAEPGETIRQRIERP